MFSLLPLDSTKSASARKSSTAELSPSRLHSHCTQLDIKVWEYRVDNDFATQFLNKLKNASQPSPSPTSVEPNGLCDYCRKLDFWSPKFHIVDNLSDLEKRALSCHFCKMRWDISSDLKRKTTSVRFDRVGSVIKMNESDPPVFSICRSEGKLSHIRST